MDIHAAKLCSNRAHMLVGIPLSLSVSQLRGFEGKIGSNISKKQADWFSTGEIKSACFFVMSNLNCMYHSEMILVGNRVSKNQRSIPLIDFPA